MTVPPAAVIFLDQMLDLATALKMVLFCRYTCRKNAYYSRDTKQAVLLGTRCRLYMWHWL